MDADTVVVVLDSRPLMMAVRPILVGLIGAGFLVGWAIFLASFKRVS